MSLLNDAATLMGTISDKQAVADALGKKLIRSMAIKDMWPEVFEHGSCTTNWRGVPPNYHSGRAPEPEHKYHEFRIAAGNGEERVYTYDEVPAILGGGKE